ncbi:MAG: asparaginase [Psychrobacter sp.]|jgi:L-asparaginase|uniref:asparaginase n=1 Tax=Psychrobacter TaxID=497 RepID=UPI000404BFA6|nr:MULTISPECIES: asparaginase [Psychrobacter]MAE40478.1 asparaginase [Psychrobacter sp.]HAM62002.1 asparaginase [Psychrobacter sp.]
MASRSTLSSLNSQSVQLIYAGGTFGSYGRPLAPLAAEVFLPALQQLVTEHDDAAFLPKLCWLDNSLIKDSSQLTPSDFVHFYTLLLSAYQAGERQFVLITGTDTLSYLGAFLAEAFAGSDISITLTGSMRPLLDSEELHAYKIDSHGDAWDNFREALRLAAAGQSGVKICFGGESWPAQTVQKIHSHDFMAFTGHHRAAYPDNSYIDKLTDTRRQHWLDDQQQVLAAVQNQPQHAHVHALYCLPNDPSVLSEQLQALLSKPPCAIILLGFGSGNVPYSPQLAEALQAAYKQGHMVVCASQCPFGGVSSSYAAGSWQYDYHVIAGGRLTLSAIYARLLWLLLRYDTPARRRQRWTYSVNQAGTSTSRQR